MLHFLFEVLLAISFYILFFLTDTNLFSSCPGDFFFIIFYLSMFIFILLAGGYYLSYRTMLLFEEVCSGGSMDGWILGI